LIYLATAVAWGILGSTVLMRTESSRHGLTGKVVSVWGAPHSQAPPMLRWESQELVDTGTEQNGKKVTVREKRTVAHALPLEKSDVKAAIELEHRQKGLLWYSTYKVRFEGDYSFRNDSGARQMATFSMPLPAAQAIYDDVIVQVGGQPAATTTAGGYVETNVAVEPGQEIRFHAGYRSQGLDRWNYRFAANNSVTQVKDFHLELTTNFNDYDFAENSLAPSEKQALGSGWRLTWNYKNLVSGYDIGVLMPEKLQPGPLAGQISYFAPVSLFFFFFLMFIITTLRGIELHPMNYFFLAAAFFAFHLLLAYLVDHISIHAAFAICSVVSIFLVVSYLRLVVGMRFAAMEAGITQFVYLVLFSYAFFFKGFTGLAVTLGAIVTLFVVMQMTGRIRWAEKFALPAPAGGGSTSSRP
jgi:inner membrane protein involved in colicin E2 resistance